MTRPRTDTVEIGDDEQAGPASATSDRHRVLSSERRRRILDVVEGGATPMELDDLALEIARREHDGWSSRADVERVRIALYHCHLPFMDDVGAITYDRETDCVEACHWSERR